MDQFMSIMLVIIIKKYINWIFIKIQYLDCKLLLVDLKLLVVDGIIL